MVVAALGLSLILLVLLRKKYISRKEAFRLLWTICAIIFVVSMIFYPRTTFDGAVFGLKTWWNIVFPALLPFFISSELLMSFGVVHFMGVLLEPVMRPLFNVPGAGSFVMAVGFTSGYPIGSMVTAKLRTQGLCTREEAERLMSFTNNSSPLFMLVAVAVGMFNNPGLGVLIAGAHYLSNLTLGILLRFYARNNTRRYPSPPVGARNPLARAFRALLQVQRLEKRPVGKIMGDAVRNSIVNLLNIGGFIILFAVIIRLLTATGFINVLASFLGVFLIPLGFSPEILPALGSGVFEMTVGSKLASETTVPLTQQVVAVGMILAWSGLSVHAQVASMIAETDIRMLPFILSRIGHTCLAGIYTYIFCKWSGPPGELGAPVVATVEKCISSSNYYFANFKYFMFFVVFIAIIILAALFFHLAVAIRPLFLKKKL